ncbi:MAG: hypothetical protein H6Q94_348, partial [Nitrospirae bacterium]|nr:hypothetical protein [Nitrospirota bacterium]
MRILSIPKEMMGSLQFEDIVQATGGKVLCGT